MMYTKKSIGGVPCDKRNWMCPRCAEWNDRDDGWCFFCKNEKPDMETVAKLQDYYDRVIRA